jgi:hypothetical protein
MFPQQNFLKVFLVSPKLRKLSNPSKKIKLTKKGITNNIFMTVKIQIIDFWVMILCNLVGGDQHFGGKVIAESSLTG